MGLDLSGNGSSETMKPREMETWLLDSRTVTIVRMNSRVTASCCRQIWVGGCSGLS